MKGVDMGSSRRGVHRRSAWLLLIKFLCTAALLASTVSRDESAEQRYWREHKKKRDAREAAEQQSLSQQRADAISLVDDLKREGAAAQQAMIAAEDGPPAPPEPPAWWEGKGEYVAVVIVVGLVGTLGSIMLARHRREAEIRRLAGGYLSDGTEVAKFKMPDWFAPAPEPTAAPASAPIEVKEVEVPVTKPIRPPDAVDKFFAEAPADLAAIRSIIKELAGAEAPAARQQILLQLHVLVHDIAKRSNCWELRPAWQLSGALELLVKRVADFPKDITPSALRTISVAVDLLHELCVPGVRPNLILEPPVLVLAADDEPLCLRALTYALEKSRIPFDTASYGAKAVMLATEKTYDVIFLDIEMPDMDGLGACLNIRKTPTNPDTPVVFVTAHSNFAMRARSVAVGGSDFIAKPFLVFELTVKTISLLMRKRLDLAKSTRAPLIPAAMPETEAPLPPPAPACEEAERTAA